MSKAKPALVLTVFLLVAVACNYVASTPEPAFTPQPPTAIPEVTSIVEPTSASTPNHLPLSEAEVERIPLEVALTAMQSGAAVIVDVRSAEAYAESHIQGAISIPLAEIENNPTALTIDKEQWIITYCTWYQEHTSARAAFVMLQNGYKNVEAILGGFQAWLDAGYPVEP